MRKLFYTIITALVILMPVTANGSLYQYFSERGQPLPSIEERAQVAEDIGMFNYSGTAEENRNLEEYLRALDNIVGGDTDIGFSVVTDYESRLVSSMTATQTTIPVASIATTDGHTLTMADLGGAVYLMLEPTSRNSKELVKCTAITSEQFSSCTRGLKFYGEDETSVTANKKAHNAGSKVVISNVHFVYEQLVDKDSSETVAGTKTFSSLIRVPTSTPSNDQEVVSWYVLNNIVQQGAATSTESVAGISELSTGQEAASSTNLGGNRPLVIHTGITTSSPYTPGLVVPVTEQDGKLNQTFLDLTNETWNFSTTTANQATITTSTIDVLNNTTTTVRQLYIDGTDANQLVDGSDASTLHTHDNYAKGPANFDDYFSYTHLPISADWEVNGSPAYSGRSYVTLGGDNLAIDILNGTSGTETREIILQTYFRFHDVASGDGAAGWGIMRNGQAVTTQSDTADQVLFFAEDTGAGDRYYVKTGDSDTGTVTEFEIPGAYTMTSWNLGRIVWNGTDDTASFYVNGDLITTINTTMPSTGVLMRLRAGSAGTGSPDGVSIGPMQISVKVN